MLRVSQAMDASSKALKGDIHFIAGTPLVVHIYREFFLRKYHGSQNTLHIDSTGSVTKKLGNTEPFYYAVVAGDGDEKSYPVGHMLSERHNVPTIAHFLMQMAYDYKTANGVSASMHPPRVVTDCSFALLHATCMAFNHMDLPAYLDTCWATAVEGSGRRPATAISLCTAHISHQTCSAIVARLGKKNKVERQAIMWIFSRMQQAGTLAELDQLFVRLCRLLMSHCAPTIDVPTLPENDCDEVDIETKHHEDDEKWKSYRLSTKWGSISRNCE